MRLASILQQIEQIANYVLIKTADTWLSSYAK